MSHPMDPDDGQYDPEGAELAAPHDPQAPEDAGYEETAFTQATPKSSGGSLPWVVAVTALAALGGVAFYAHHTVSDAEGRAEKAEAVADQVSSKYDKMDQERKAALAQASDLTSKSEELNTKVASLSAELKEKDTALTRLQESQSTLVAKLRAAAKANPKGRLPKLVLAALPKPGNAALPDKPGHGKRRHRR